MSILKPGFNPGIENSEYHSDREYISSSGLKMILGDTREYYNKYVIGSHESKSSDSMDFGSYVHALILEPHLVEKEFAIYEGTQKRGAKWQDFTTENSDKICLTRSQHLQAMKALDMFNKESVVIDGEPIPLVKFFKGGNAEETLCTELDGVKVKVRFDYRKEFGTFGSINDIKTTSFPISTKKEIEQVSKRWGYELSAALYVDAVQQVTGLPHNFFFCYINTAKCMIQLVKASDQMLSVGRAKYKEAIQILKQCRETGEYGQNGIVEIDYIGD